MLNWSERGHVLATFDEEVVYCRVVGVGNMNNCAPFQSFSVRLQKQGYREFVLDFSRCDGLDSTFLGILLGIAVGDSRCRAHVVVVNASESVKRILGEVGIDRLVEVHAEAMQLPEIPMQRLDPLPAEDELRGDQDRIQMILEAHENLCRLAGSNNRDRFGSFLNILRQELATEQQSKDEGSGDA